MNKNIRALFAFFFLGVATPAFAQYFPQTGKEALHQRSLDARARLNVLSISLQPGYEDLATLAYFRIGVGARIVSAYVTNGEAGESDVRAEYPSYLAAMRRSEAAAALSHLGGEEYFLNMQDFGAARDTAVVRSQWSIDTLRMRLNKLLTDLRPDVILIARDWAVDGRSPQREVLADVLLNALRKLEPTEAEKRAGGADEMFRWNVDRVLLETGSRVGARVPVDRVHPFWKKSYLMIGQEAGRAYASLAVRRTQWYGSGQPIAYEAIYPRPSRQMKSVDEGLPRPAPARIMGIDAGIAGVARTIAGGTMSTASQTDALRRVAALIDSVDDRLTRPLDLPSQARKICMQWKISLESLRLALLGVEVRYSVNPMILTERQLAHLTIDSVAGIRPGDSTWVYFPFIEQQWYVDESPGKIRALRLRDSYRLLTPSRLDHDLPAAGEGLTQTSVGKNLTFFIMCKSKTREQNFVYRATTRMLYSERFSAEVLTPIVRVFPGEQVIVRNTNHSRDGVRDSVYVDDSLATSGKKEFRINVKDQAEVDTLVLDWKRSLGEGTYIVPVSIATKKVAKFAARQFEARVDSNIRVALITGFTDGTTGESLRRLGVGWKELRNARAVTEQLGGFKVAIVDRRAMTLMRDLVSWAQYLKRFVEGGGHLIVLAQDAGIWNSAPLVEGLHLTSSDALEEAAEVESDSLHQVFTRPNRITWEDWEFWLFRRAHNILSGPALETALVPLKAKLDRSPLIAEWRMGSGTLTYVDLALQQQLLNIHPGAFRLLANLISY
ncbi:MAG: PIG-L family deacetylase [Ignavibacteriales bacterium]|nr:PIG-L family deacetylase [Ignavibacteriales bacterium]